MPRTDPCVNGRPLSEYEKIRESNIEEQDRVFFEKNGYHLRTGREKIAGDFKSNWCQKEEDGDNKEGGEAAGMINDMIQKLRMITQMSLMKQPDQVQR